MNAVDMRFNLIDEPWIPCTLRGSAGQEERRELGLREVLVQAREIVELTDPSPLVTAALHRLLLALLHRLYGPTDRREWKALYGRGWDTGKLDEYLERRRDRFDLFDDQHPFYQTASIGVQYATPISKLTHELAGGNNATLFDHTTEIDTPAFRPARAARSLVAYQAYAVGGLVSFDDKAHKSATAAPLVKGAVAVVRGGNLFETLMLNLVDNGPERQRHYATRAHDRTAWERDEETRPVDRLPDGYLDLLTWQSRRIKLFPERDAHGDIVVPRVAVLKGYGFTPGFERPQVETMVAFKKPARVTAGQDPFPAVGFRADRALWRDSLALFQAAGNESEPPKTFQWLHGLADDEAIDAGTVFPLDLFGLVTDKASVLLWRHERLPLPLAYLDPANGGLVDALKEALNLAEETGQALRTAGFILAERLLAPESDQPNARKPQAEDTRRLATSFELERAYWPHLDVAFKLLIEDLPQPHDRVEERGLVTYGVVAIPRWRELLKRTARDVFDAATRGLDTSSRSLKATALAKRTLEWGLAKALDTQVRVAPETAPSKEGDGIAV